MRRIVVLERYEDVIVLKADTLTNSLTVSGGTMGVKRVMEKQQPCYFISAGEPSGDLLGGDLIRALRERLPEIQAFGVAGPQMRSAGIDAIADIKDLSVMGFIEVLKQVPRLKRLETRLLQEIDRKQPKFVVLIDYPGFHLRLAEFLKERQIPVFQYVAPQLWAWGQHRVKRLRRVTDHVLGIVPFEEEFFKSRSVNYTYVGTPQVDRVEEKRSDRKVPSEPVIGMFPGSRVTEVRKILPLMLEVRKRLPLTIHVCLSVAPSVDIGEFSDLFRAAGYQDFDEKVLLEMGRLSLPSGVELVRGNSVALMGNVTAALVTSGTATLECGLWETPMAVAYRLNPLSWQLAKRLVKIDSVSLVNLIAGRKIVHEFLQDIDPQDVTDHLLALATDSALRSEKITALKDLLPRLKGKPHAGAAEVISKNISKNFVCSHQGS